MPKSPSRNTRLVVAAAVAVPLVACVAVLLALIVAGDPFIWRPDFHYPERPSHYYTAREALEIALPQVPSWHQDALITFIYTGPGDPQVWGIRDDGKVPIWIFDVASPSSMVRTAITVIDDVAFVSGLDGHPELPLRSEPKPLPLDWVIDTHQAFAIARTAGARGLPTTIMTARRSRVDAGGSRTGEVIALGWLLSYGDRGRAPYVLVDAFSGAILQNDFAP
jgi:hypothetical protein